METSYVLSGLSRKAGLCLLSLLTTPVSHFTKELCPEKTGHVVKEQERDDTMLKKEECLSDAPHSQEHHNMITESAAKFESPSINDSVSSEETLCSESTNASSNCTCCASTEQESLDIHGSSLISKAVNDSSSCSSNERSGTSDVTALNKCFETSKCLCETEGVLPCARKNFSDVENCTVPSNSSVDYCATAANVSQCNTAANTEDTMHDKVESEEDEYVCVTDDEPDENKTYSDSKWDTSDDLPLMANVDEVLVTHYVLNLSVDFSAKVMSGDITLFLKPTTELILQRQFQLCLDCSLVQIESVEEIDLKDDFSVRHYGSAEQYDTNDQPGGCSYPPDVFHVDRHKKVPVALPYTLLPYAVRNWCVRIWKPHKLGRAWPRCVRIKYCTRPEGKSLTWATDQDNRYMFTVK